jgi:hypothetical protein
MIETTVTIGRDLRAVALFFAWALLLAPVLGYLLARVLPLPTDWQCTTDHRSAEARPECHT